MTRHNGQAPTAPRPTQVLVADDDDEMRSLLACQLRAHGYEVVEASDGDEVSDILHAVRDTPRSPDVIVMDIRMPRRTGLELLADLRKERWFVPVILITGFGERDVHDKAQQLGAQAVLDKPFDVDDLQSAVRRFLDTEEQ